MKKPLIFVTNDDGVEAKGLDYAIDIARKFGRVVVVAPEHHQSGLSHAITMFRPLHLKKVREEEDLVVYACSGTPVDCVKMAFDYLLGGEIPALSLSGINHGSNSAINVLYSGTMGAAIEASFYGAPAVGLSLLDHDLDADFGNAAACAEEIVRRLLAEPVQGPLCLNVNVPVVPLGELKGIKVCRQAQGHWLEVFDCRQDPRGREYFWLKGDFCNAEPESTDTDEWALCNGYASVVPIDTDLTHYKQMPALKSLERAVF